MSNDDGAYANPQLLVSASDLAARLGSSGDLSLLTIDLRPVEDFSVGHVPLAVHLDLFGISLIDTNPAPLDAFLWMVAHLLTSRGVSAKKPVIVYDEHSGMRAARAFWFLEFFGHPDVRVLDGGFGSWRAKGFPVETVAVPPSKGDWVAGRVDNRLATWREVEKQIGAKDAVILDTRSDAEYRGKTVRAKRGGAVPSAIHIEWTRNLAEDGTFKNAPALRAMYENAGVTPDKEVISYCQGGYRAAHSYLALRLLGYQRVRNYIGSWKEWGDRYDLPIELPSDD